MVYFVEMASLSVPTFRSVENPKIILTIDPIAHKVVVEITETCPSCAGYGSPCGGCQGDGLLHHACGTYNAVTRMYEKVENTLAGLLGVEATKTTLDTIRAFVSG